MLVCGLFILTPSLLHSPTPSLLNRVLAALGKADFGLYGVVGGMMVIALLAFTMRLVHISPEAVGRAAKRSLEGCRNATVSLSMGSDPMEAPLESMEA